jgi:Carboxypeptidase regulatory-like domain
MLPILWIIFSLLGLQVLPGASQGAIQGRVVRAGASAVAAAEQVAGALVELKPGNRSTSTDAAGAFSFQNLPAGQYTISVTHAGFILQEDPRRGLTTAGLKVTLAAAETLKDILLPMLPAPVIEGTVFDPAGQPQAAALVRAYLRQYSVYGTRLRIVKKAMTDDMGEFRLFGLRFGEYFVSASHSDRDRAEATGNTELSANVSKADDGYVTVYYDSAEELADARPARLTPGFDEGRLSVYFRDPARFRIRGQVVPPIPPAQVMIVPKGSDLAESHYFVPTNANGAFEIRAVSPGSYLLLAVTPDRTYWSDVIGVNVTDADVEGVRLALVRAMPVFGAVTWEGNPRANLSGLHVRLQRSTTDFDQTFVEGVQPDGAFAFGSETFPQVPQANFDVAVEPLPPGSYIKTITSGGSNLLAGGRFLPGQPVRILLAAATDNVDVRVTKGADPAAGAQVVLIPNPPLRRRADRYLSGFTDAYGSLHLTAVPPGLYTAYAFEQIEADAYYELGYTLGTVDRFRGRAVPVMIGETGSKSIELKVIPAEETAGGLR